MQQLQSLLSSCIDINSSQSYHTLCNLQKHLNRYKNWLAIHKNIMKHFPICSQNYNVINMRMQLDPGVLSWFPDGITEH